MNAINASHRCLKTYVLLVAVGVFWLGVAAVIYRHGAREIIINWRVSQIESELRKVNPGWQGRISWFGSLTATDYLLPLSPYGLTVEHGEDFFQLISIRNMRLKMLVISYTKVDDLAPLRGLNLRDLRLMNAPVSDLTPLKGMPLISLDISGTQVTDLTPLKGMPLKNLFINDTHIKDLTPLKEMPLKMLILNVPISEKHSLPDWLLELENDGCTIGFDLPGRITSVVVDGDPCGAPKSDRKSD